jgi:hypothetical protein
MRGIFNRPFDLAQGGELVEPATAAAARLRTESSLSREN